MIWIQSNALAAKTASTNSEPASAWAEMILRELGRSEAGGLVAELVKWTAIRAPRSQGSLCGKGLCPEL